MLCNPGHIERHIGQTLTASQVAEAHALCLAVTDYARVTYGIDYDTGALVESVYEPGPRVWLRHAPVSAVTSVTVRIGLTATPVALVSGTDYEIVDLATGLISIPGIGLGWPRGYGYDRVTVTYTPSATVQARHQLAATMIVAHWLRRQTEGVAPGIKSYSVGGGDVSVAYTDTINDYGVPSEATALFRAGRMVAIA